MTICDRTGLTKPECHCPACTAALVARHAPGTRSVPARPAAKLLLTDSRGTQPAASRSAA
jgi:hypothetical protein